MKSILLIVVNLCINLIGYKVEAVRIKGDFARAVKTSYFVDKTLFIEELMTDVGNIKVITAPSGFGKSTILDMVKRFLEINVDDKGEVVQPNLTENYKLFCSAPLNICRNKTFVDLHLGQHPVLHIDYSPLKDLSTFDKLHRLRVVLKETYDKHKYLAENLTLLDSFQIGVENFTRILTDNPAKVTRYHLRISFYLLSGMLSNYFGRKVIILIDDYDSYIHSLLLENIQRTSSFKNFLAMTNEALLTDNQYLDRAVLTGILNVILPRTTLPRNTTCNNIRYFRYLAVHPFSKYYGFTENEIDSILKVNKQNLISEEVIRKRLKEYFNGYAERNGNRKLYGILSVINYFENKLKPVNNWIRTKYSNTLSNVLTRSPLLLNIIKHMVLERKRVAVVLSETLSAKEISYLNSQLNFKRRANLRAATFLSFLHEIGYVAPTVDSDPLPVLKIPNRETYSELCAILTRDYIKQFKYLPFYVWNLQDAVDAFQPHLCDIKTIENLHRALKELFHRSEHYPQSGKEIQSVLLVMLGEKFSFYKQATKVTRLRDVHRVGRIEITLLNSQGVVVVIETEFKTKVNDSDLDMLARQAHSKILTLSHGFVLNNLTKNAMNRTRLVYIGLGFNNVTREISMAYSSCVDQITNPTIFNSA